MAYTLNIAWIIYVDKFNDAKRFYFRTSVPKGKTRSIQRTIMAGATLEW